jgi:hypothetical protein
MARLYLFAEGQTEQTFADILMKPYLSQYEVYIYPILIAHARKKGKVHRGGGRNYEPMKNDILRFLRQEEKHSDVFFTTMIDLYAIPSDFPKLAQAEKMRQNPLERAKFLEQRFADDIKDKRFIPYIQLHEYEAYLFSDPGCFEGIDDNCTKKINELRAIINQYKNPELINDGQDTAPSKRIKDKFPCYAKAHHGPLLAKRIGLTVIREKCPHFNNWLEHLEKLNNLARRLG